MDEHIVARAFDNLDTWLSTNGWAGYDPYDIRGQDWYVRLFGRQHWFFKKLRGALALIEAELPPLGLRKTLRIAKEINPKAMGLLATAYMVQARNTNNPDYEKKSEQILSWLAANASRDYPGVCWGYPFHWQSRVFFPRGTPSVVVTATIGDAWLNHFERTSSGDSLRIAEGIAQFFLHGLNRPIDEEDRVCFSYTPLDDFKVHNANLFAAAFLARLGAIVDNQQYLEMSLKAVRYTLSEQNADGSFYYWGSEPATIIDHYHTGFVLRHLDTVRRATSMDFISNPLARAYSFYWEQLFDKRGNPKFTPDSLYPIDIHSCAEAIICVCQLGTLRDETDRLRRLFALTQDKMLTDQGWYVAAIREKHGKELKQHVPFLRWGQAWMLLALARLQETLVSSSDKTREQQCASA